MARAPLGPKETEEGRLAREALGPKPGREAPVAERAAHARERTRLTFRRLSGLDRSGPPPEQTAYGQPWRVWTIPNVIGFVRAILIPIFLVTAFSSENGTDALPAVLFAVCAWGDYADGITARITGQYSRLGALMDPVIDRCLVISGVVVVFAFDLLPRWALVLLVLRELYVLYNGRIALKEQLELKINWPGRIAVGPVMSALFFALCDLRTLAAVFLYIGLALSYYAAFLYRREGRRQRASRGAPSTRA
ncbi:MAG: CDP-alcohol phosphatidyltransferase family protein [Solirubrobacterales bacterium]|nr:CDP-alcohol phosphatidyltransferase family protein [Solirubrobacterales bacterium]